eukprot:8155519-Pyramimonas_sp.AAC.3
MVLHKSSQTPNAESFRSQGSGVLRSAGGDPSVFPRPSAKYKAIYSLPGVVCTLAVTGAVAPVKNKVIGTRCKCIRIVQWLTCAPR